MRVQSLSVKALTACYDECKLEGRHSTSMAAAFTEETAKGLIAVAASASAVCFWLLWGTTLRIIAMEDSAIEK